MTTYAHPLPQSLIDLVRDARHGLILVGGLPGSGRSALIQQLTGQLSPLRYKRIYDITQEPEVQGRVEAGYPQGVVARLALARRHPANILVGDGPLSGPTIRAAVEAAAAGHLVIMSTTAPSANVALSMLPATFGFDPTFQYALSHALRAVVTQKWVPRVDGGNRPVREILFNNGHIGSLLQSQAGAHLSFEALRAAGMRTFDLDLIEMWALGLITAETVRLHASDTHELPAEFDAPRSPLPPSFAFGGPAPFTSPSH